MREARRLRKREVPSTTTPPVTAQNDGRSRYNTKVLAELLNAKPREIKAFLRGQLAPGRTQELQTELLAAGIPL